MRADGAASTPGLHCVVVRGWVGVGRGRCHTCPPEKPTATTASWSPFERNFGWTIDVVVILIELRRVRWIYCGGDEDNGGPFV
jgi:hypothetical protein